MTTRPTTSPAFATAATQTSGAETGQVPRLDPGAGFKAQGFYANTRVGARWINFLLGIAGDWLQYLDEKNAWLFNPKNFGAVGDGVADDTAAMQAAVTAAGAVQARVICGSGTYRLIAAITLPVGVSIAGRGVVKFLKDHASNDTFTWVTGTETGCGVTFEDIQFEAAQVNTGRVWFGQGGATIIVTFVRCSVNRADDKLRGQLGRFDDAASRMTFIDCNCRMMNTASTGFTGTGEAIMRGGQYSVPAAYANDFSTISTGRYFGVTFTQLLSTIGGFAFIFASDGIVEGCRFIVTDNGASDLTYAYKITTGTLLIARGNSFGKNTTGICYPCKNIGTGAAAGSVIQGLPVLQQTANLPGYTLRSYAEHNQILSPSATIPTFTFETPFYEGQPMDMTIRNDHASAAWIGLLAFLGPVIYKAADFGSMNAGYQVTARFVGQRVTSGGTGPLVWVQTGSAVIVQ